MTGWHCRRASLPCPDRAKRQALATTRRGLAGLCPGIYRQRPIRAAVASRVAVLPSAKSRAFAIGHSVALSFELRLSGVLGSTQLR
jgi:hypothetical protein